MTLELIAIIGMGVALLGVMQPQLWSVRRAMVDLRERMTRLEGLFEEFTRRQPQTGWSNKLAGRHQRATRTKA